MDSRNMLNPVSWIPAKYLLLAKLAAIALAVAAGLAWWHAHNVGQQKIGYDRAMAEVKAEQGKLADDKRRREDEDQKGANQEADHAQQQIDDLERQRNTARDDADRMRRLYRDAAARGRQAVACAAGAVESEPGADPLGMFADLLERADRRAEAVAGYADRLRIAGESCERRYDAVAGNE